jgi:hypothetical protein
VKAIVYPIVTGLDYAYAAPPLFIESDSADAAIAALRDEGYRIKRVTHDVRSIARDEVIATRSAFVDVLEKLHEIAREMSDDDTINVYRIAVCRNI